MNQPRRARRAGGVEGRALLLFRLARQDIRHHVAQAVLLVAAIAAATAVLSLAFALNGVITSPYQQTMAATKGPDVVAQSADDPYTSVTSPADLAALVALNHARGVAAHSGPYPIAGGTGPVGPVMRSTDIVTSVQVEGREPGVATVDQPKVTDGTWIRPGGVVVERSFAEAANLRLGQAITLNVPRAEQVLTAITISLVTLAALTAIFAATATVLDARRASAVTLALGATPQQVRAGLVMAQVIPALPGAILGLPLGIGLFKVAGHGLSGLPPVLWLVAAVLGTVLVVAALTSIPARIGLRRPVAEMLQTEAT
jgi:hypothetical protein